MEIDQREDGWMMLASAIMESYAEEYAEMFPRDAVSQEDYDSKDLLYYKLQRERILNRVATGPLRHMAVKDIYRRGFEMMRERYKKDAGVPWEG